MELRERTEVAEFSVWSEHDTNENTFLIEWLTHNPETRYGLKCIDSWSSKKNVVIATFERHRVREEGNYRFVLLNPLEALKLETYERAAIGEALAILNSDKDLETIRSENKC